MPESNGSSNAESIRERVAAAKADLAPKPRELGAAGNAHLAWRMVIDLAAGVGVGAALGYGLDSLIGIRPILMVVFTLLGFAAGVNLMLRTAREFQQRDAGRNESGD